MAEYVPLSGRGLVLAVYYAAQTWRLDPLAVFANAIHEGLAGEIGQNGSAYGPWQMSSGQFLPADQAALGLYSLDVQRWAWSEAGVRYALSKMADTGARGLTGAAATRHICQYFELPADLQTELTARVETWRNLKARGTGVTGYLSGLAGGPTLPAAPAPVDTPKAVISAPPKANAAWQRLLHVYARVAPARCHDVIRIANRLPRELGARPSTTRLLASADSVPPGEAVTLDDANEYDL